jgi:hypothetical protein
MGGAALVLRTPTDLHHKVARRFECSEAKVVKPSTRAIE